MYSFVTRTSAQFTLFQWHEEVCVCVWIEMVWVFVFCPDTLGHRINNVKHTRPIYSRRNKCNRIVNSVIKTVSSVEKSPNFYDFFKFLKFHQKFKITENRSKKNPSMSWDSVYRLTNGKILWLKKSHPANIYYFHCIYKWHYLNAAEPQLSTTSKCPHKQTKFYGECVPALIIGKY